MSIASRGLDPLRDARQTTINPELEEAFHRIGVQLFTPIDIVARPVLAKQVSTSRQEMGTVETAVP